MVDGSGESYRNSVYEACKHIPPRDRSLEGREEGRTGGREGWMEGGRRGNIWKGRLKMGGRRGEKRKAGDSDINLKRK